MTIVLDDWLMFKKELDEQPKHLYSMLVNKMRNHNYTHKLYMHILMQSDSERIHFIENGGWFYNDDIMYSAKVAKLVPQVFLFLSSTLRDNFDIAMLSMHHCPSALFMASDRLKDNPFIIRNAMMCSRHAITHASKRLKSDRKFIVEMIKMFGGDVLVHASENLRDNIKIAKLAIKSDLKNIKCLSSRVRSNKKIIIMVIKKDPSNFCDICRTVKNNKYYVMQLVKIQPYIYQYLRLDFKSDLEILENAFKKPQTVHVVPNNILHSENNIELFKIMLNSFHKHNQISEIHILLRSLSSKERCKSEIVEMFISIHPCPFVLSVFPLKSVLRNKNLKTSKKFIRIIGHIYTKIHNRHIGCDHNR